MDSPEQLPQARRTRLRRFFAYVELLRARWSLLAALGAGGLGVFFKLATQLRSDDGLQRADQALLDAIFAHRLPSWNAAALELTALGSGTVMVVFVVIALFFLLVVRDWRGALQLLIASLGGNFFTGMLKQVLERERPDISNRLAEVSSYSFPSGHSLASASIYLTLALVLARRLPTLGGRIGIFAIALLLSATIGFTRAYVGVHFPSDIAAGLTFGWGWALLVSAVFSYISAKTAEE